MLNIKTTFDKNCFHKNQKDALLLIEIMGNNVSKKANSKRLKLNTSLCIDISGSMNELISGGIAPAYSWTPPAINPNPRPINPWVDPNNPFQQPIWLGGQHDKVRDIYQNGCVHQKVIEHVAPVAPKRKLDLAKSAALKAIDVMRDGDILSIVLFDDKTTVLQSAIELNASNRENIKSKIKGICIRGGTNLHEGWVTAAAEVSKNLGKDYLSSVLLLSDGQTLLGITDTDTIASNVAKLQKNGIITSTFGIGLGFNEDLLQAMSNAGSGNFYYIDEEDKTVQMFEDEFNGLTNVSGSDIKLSFNFEEGFSVDKQMNGFELKDGNYVIPTVSNKTKKALLFSVKLNRNMFPVKCKGMYPQDNMVSVGKLVVSYKDENGTERVEKISLDNGYVSSKAKWEAEAFESEVKVQETLLIVAEEKVKATKLLDIGDLSGAQGLLRASANYVSSTGFADNRLMEEVSLLNKTVANSATTSSQSLRKDISNQSYLSRNSKSY